MLRSRLRSLLKMLGILACSLLISRTATAGQDNRPKPDPNSFETNYQLAEFYFHSGKLQQGIPYMERAQSLKPSDYKSGYDLALAYLETKDYAKARQQIRAMLGHQDSSELHSLLADVEESDGKYVRAAEEYERAARMDPSEEHIFDWGTELLVHRAWQPAEEVFKRGIQLFPKSAKLQVGLGIALYSRGNYEPAVEALCAATDLDPSESWPYVFLAKIYAISPSSAEDVKKRLARFLELQPNNPQAAYYYALSLWQREETSHANLGEVESLLRRSATLDDRFADAHLQLGILYEDQHKFPEAIRELERAIELQPDLTTAHYHLAQAYLRTGEKSRSSEEFHRFEKLREHDQMQTENERNEIRQFIVSMKEPAAAAR